MHMRKEIQLHTATDVYTLSDGILTYARIEGCADRGRRGPDRVDKIKLFNLPSNFQKIRLRSPSPDKKRLFFEDLPENNSDPHMLHMSS